MWNNQLYQLVSSQTTSTKQLFLQPILGYRVNVEAESIKQKIILKLWRISQCTIMIIIDDNLSSKTPCISMPVMWDKNYRVKWISCPFRPQGYSILVNFPRTDNYWTKRLFILVLHVEMVWHLSCSVGNLLQYKFAYISYVGMLIMLGKLGI